MQDHEAEQALVDALLAGDKRRSDELLETWSALAEQSVACRLCLAHPHAGNGFSTQTVSRALPPKGWPPLLYLCSSRFDAGAESTAQRQLAIARKLVTRGADVSAGVREAETTRGYRTALGAAIGCARNPALAKLLIDAGADVADGPTLYEGCAMWYAVRERDTASLQSLLDAKPPRWHVCHALPHALRYNDLQLTRLLLENSGDPNWTVGSWGCKGNCLHEAVMLDNDPAILEALLERGAKVDFKDRGGRTPLAIAVCLNRRALAAMLRKHGAEEDAVRHVDHWVGACMAGDGDAAAQLIEQFAAAPAINALADKSTTAAQRREARSQLACQFKPEDHLWVCRAVGRIAGDAPPALLETHTRSLPLLLAGGLDPDAVDDDGERALHLAAAGNASAISALLAYGADATAVNFAGETPLDVARKQDRQELAELLVQARSDLHRQASDPGLGAAFERAADAVVDGDLDALRRLLAERPALATARSQRPHHGTLLHYVGANGVEHWRQRTPANAVAIINCLVASGADPNAVCHTYQGGPGEHTLGLLTSSRHAQEAGLTLAMVAALAAGGATLDDSYALLAKLHQAREQGELPAAAQRVDATARQSARALVESAMLGETEIAIALLNAGMDVNARRDDGATALHQAAIEGNEELVQALLERGAELRLRDHVFDSTAAGWAVAGGHEELGRTLQARLEELAERGEDAVR